MTPSRSAAMAATCGTAPDATASRRTASMAAGSMAVVMAIVSSASGAGAGRASDSNPWLPRAGRAAGLILTQNARRSRVVLASGCLDQAAVDDVVDAGDVPGAAGRQEGDQRGDLLGSGEAAGGESADPGDDRLTGGFGVHAGRLGDGLGDAVLAEPQFC